MSLNKELGPSISLEKEIFSQYLPPEEYRAWQEVFGSI